VPEPILAPRSALASVVVPGHYGAPGGDGVTLSECRGMALFSVAARAGKAAELSAAVERAFGLSLPTRPACTANDAIVFIWAGPDFWLAICSSDDFANQLRTLNGPLAAITDLTGSQVIFRISGPRARDGLMKLVPIDLDESVFRTGSAALTVASHIRIHLWQIDETPTYEIACPRSYAVSFWHSLMTAFEEYGYCAVQAHLWFRDNHSRRGQGKGD